MPAAAFITKKQKILQRLGVPDGDYTDLSPKGSVDEGIRALIQDINNIEGLVTTSSCAGRISVYLDGLDKSQNAGGESELSSSATGGKGGGKWLFVSHDPLVIPSYSSSNHLHSLFGLKESYDDKKEDTTWKRLVHFKFEAMVRRQPQILKHISHISADLAYLSILIERCSTCTICCFDRWVS
jgi:tRNA wybutosine-synthesizing protein 3